MLAMYTTMDLNFAVLDTAISAVMGAVLGAACGFGLGKFVNQKSITMILMIIVLLGVLLHYTASYQNRAFICVGYLFSVLWWFGTN